MGLGRGSGEGEQKEQELLHGGKAKRQLGFEIDIYLKKYSISGHSYENIFQVAASLKDFY